MQNNLHKDHINQTVIASIEQFYLSERTHLLSHQDFLFFQLHLLKKRWLIIQTILMVSVYLFLKFSPETLYFSGALGIAACLFIIFMIPDLWRERNANASELISTCYYSLEHVYAAKMMIIGIYDLLLLSLFFLATGLTTKLTIYTLIIYFILPLTVVACTCFCLLSVKNSIGSFATICICVFASISLFLLTSISKIYQKISISIWIALVILSLIFLALSIYRLVHPLRGGQHER